MQNAQNYVTRRLPTLPQMNSDRYTAIVIWLVGVYLSRNALVQMGITNEIAAVITAVVFQWFLTKGQQAIWRGKSKLARFTIISVPALLIDVWFNAAGAWPYAKAFGATDAWKMANEINGTNAAFSLTAALLTALLAGVFIAGAPENLWNGEEAI